MKTYIVNKCVDYLTVTSHEPRSHFSKKQFQLVKPVNPAYDMAEMHVSGMLHMWHSRKPKLGHHYVMSGKPLQWIRDHIMTDTELVADMMQFGVISRIDIAVTSMPDDGSEHELQPHKIMELCRDGLLVSKLKPAKEIAENGNTETKYIGNPQKRRRLFRAYDKGIQLDLDEYKKREIRYELETGMNAHVVGKMVASSQDIGAIIRRYVDFPHNEVWISIMGAASSELKHTDTGERDINAHEREALERQAKWLWLNESIAPMIARLINANRDIDDITLYENEFLHNFMHEIYSKVDRK
jgi:hypothetical protein